MISKLRGQKQEDLREFEASVVYTAGSMRAKGYIRRMLSQKKKKVEDQPRKGR